MHMVELMFTSSRLMLIVLFTINTIIDFLRLQTKLLKNVLPFVLMKAPALDGHLMSPKHVTFMTLFNFKEMLILK